MSGLASEIEQAEAEVAELASRLANAFARIDADAHEKRLAVIQETDQEREALNSRLHHLRSALREAKPRTLVVAPKSKAKPSRSPSEIILALLAGATDPVPTSEIDAAVISGGWTKAASEKAKTRLRDQGLIHSEKRRYTITEKGKEEIGGR
ncbi:hypothetical protein [Antarcticirhabdus aurantiaca]|uniref:Uncharacterized protein n=1 Tax=Antarcticirhabdus aurantiaca TaxID=2606717 RepID=A0ACD4NP81_9HYPH|nr:hypothetical protein [Antarcticirhabdus aurantiaca]WAJ28475.1 hypothetical protein OXU80_27315 [Jeongeuplla avenae]